MSKLRVIHLFEADYNLIIGLIFGCRAMYSGVDNKTLHTSQWAQPSRQCSDVVVMRELTLAVAKLTKTPIGGFENDASACYDRIVMNLVSAIFDRMGIPIGLCDSKSRRFNVSPISLKLVSENRTHPTPAMPCLGSMVWDKGARLDQ